MKQYLDRSILQTHPVPYATKMHYGCEVYSNDRTLLIHLQKRWVIAGENGIQCSYTATFFVKDGNGWIKTTEETEYRGFDLFLAALERAEEFSHAYRELNEME